MRGVIDALNRQTHADDRVEMAMAIAGDRLIFVRVR